MRQKKFSFGRDILSKNDESISSGILFSHPKILQIIESIRDHFYILDSDWNFVCTNRTTAAVIRKEPHELVGRNFWELFPWLNDSVIEHNYRVAMEKKESRQFEFKGVYSDKYYSITVSPYDNGILVLGNDISEQRKSEELRKITEEQFQKPLMSMTDMYQVVEMVYDKDENPVDYIFRAINPVIEHLVDKKSIEITGKKASHVFGFVEAKWIEVFSSVDKTGKPVRTGSFSKTFGKWFEIYAWKSEKKNVAAIITDISDLKNTEEALRLSNLLANERLNEIENLYNTVPVGLCVLDMDLRFIRINSRLAQINGFLSDDHIGKTIPEVLPEFYNNAKQILQKIIETGQAQLGIEFTGKTPSQPDIVRSWSEDWVPIRNSSGEIVAISVAVVEQTEEKRAKEKLLKNEKKLKAAKKALELSQQKLKLLLENGKIGIWERDLLTDRLTWDSKTEEIFGFKPGTFDGKRSTFRKSVHEEDILNIENIISKSIRSGAPFDVVLRTKPVKGESRYLTEKGFIIKDKNGNPEKIMGICYDISELKKGAEQVIMKMNEELLRSNRELQQFAYVASHDLQEPLRMVSSFTQLLQQRYRDKLDSTAQEYISFAVEGSKRMYDLLNGLLTYSRVQTKGRDFGLVEMNQVVEKVKANLHLIIEKSQAVIGCRDLGTVVADENQMIQVLQNLIDNAIKFSKGQPHISISSEFQNGFRVFSVSDNGIGIAPEYYERIFRIFQRLHAPSVYPGTGIGLSICQRIVERHGGRIWVESEPGIGSVFYFSVPDISITTLKADS